MNLEQKFSPVHNMLKMKKRGKNLLRNGEHRNTTIFCYSISDCTFWPLLLCAANFESVLHTSFFFSCFSSFPFLLFSSPPFPSPCQQGNPIYKSPINQFQNPSYGNKDAALQVKVCITCWQCALACTLSLCRESSYTST